MFSNFTKKELIISVCLLFELFLSVLDFLVKLVKCSKVGYFTKKEAIIGF